MIQSDTNGAGVAANNIIKPIQLLQDDLHMNCLFVNILMACVTCKLVNFLVIQMQINIFNNTPQIYFIFNDFTK